MKGYWIFPAITSLLCVWLVLEADAILPIFLVILWFIRLITLKKRQILIVSLLFGMSFSLISWQVQGSLMQSSLDQQTSEFSVFVKPTTLTVDGDRLRFYGEIDLGEETEEVVVRYRIATEEEQQRWLNDAIPTFVKIEGKLIEPSRSRNWYQFDYQQYLKRESIHWIVDAETVQVDEDSRGEPSFSYGLDHFRQMLLTQVDQRVNGVTADYIKAMIFADRRSLSEETMEQFRVIGIVHLLSISGLHIHFLISGFRAILLKMGITKETTNGLLLLCLPVYGTVAGWGASVFRAVIQTFFSIFFVKVNWKLEPIDYWVLTLLSALLIQPTIIYGIGFQLSYVLSGLLILLNHSLVKVEEQAWKQTMLVSLVINLASIPILAYHFYEFPWVTLFANALFIPIFTLTILPLLVSVLFFSFLLNGSILFVWINEASNYVLKGIEGLLTFSESLPFSSIITGRLSFLGLFFIYVGLWAIIYSVENNQKRKRSFIIGLLLFASGVFSRRFSPIGEVVMLDVGQGESIVVKEPYGRQTYLIDTGGQVVWWEREEWQEQETPFSLGKDTVVPALKALGVHQLDVIYLSHADTDHVGALLDVVEEIPTQKIRSTQDTFSDENVQEMIPSLIEKGIQLESIVAPMQIEEDLFLLYPWATTNSRNDDSLVLYGTIGEHTWLFTGDLEEEGERQLIQRYPTLTVDLLKVGHHGSQTSTQDFFLETIQPHTAWISAGENNSYGHPHSNVLQELNENQVHIYRTDTQGAIRYRYTDQFLLKRVLSEPITILIDNERQEGE